MAPSAACECGAEEQTTDHVVLQCPIHRLHGLTVLDDQTIDWLLKHLPRNLVLSVSGFQQLAQMTTRLRTGCARRKTPIYKWCEQVKIE